MPSKIEVPSKQELIEVYNSNLSMLKTAEHFGVSKKLVMNWMNGYGIRRMSRSIRRELKEPIRRFIDEGIYTTQEVAQVLCVSVDTVHQVCRDIGKPKAFDSFHKGFITTKFGYIKLRIPLHPFADSKGYVAEHRLVVEDYLGRYLDPDEVVHHINGCKSDNSLDNLDICSLEAHTAWHHTKDIV